MRGQVGQGGQGRGWRAANEGPEQLHQHAPLKAGAAGAPPTPAPLDSAVATGCSGSADTSVRAEITISEARLVRLFDKLKGTQDLFVQLVRGYPDGSEKVVARTVTCVQGDLTPRWNEKFTFGRGTGVILKFRVWAEHYWRQNVLCGEVELDLRAMWQQIVLGQRREASDYPLRKKGEPTGTLRISFARATHTFLSGIFAVVPSEGKDFRAALQELLNKPEELEEFVRHRFSEVAEPVGRDRRPAMGPHAMEDYARLLAQKLKVPHDVFGDIHQMFWRFEVSGEKLLYEGEAVRLILYMLFQYRDAITPPRTKHTVQLGGQIAHRKLDEKFKIQKELGRGGQGVVYLATDTTTHQQAVVKMYGKTHQKAAGESITQEFELLTSLKHPKIARVFEIFQDWDNFYIVQEPYFGGDLTTAVSKAYDAGAKVDERWLAHVMHQVLQGVEFLHVNGVIHCDLKEANVMVAGREDWRRPQVIVIDFGLANKFSAKSGVGGTPGYMPPEVWDHGLWTPRGDVFSVGVMLFTLRTGQHPFYRQGLGVEEIANLTRRSQVPQMGLGSSQLVSMVRSMLERSFLDRPTASQVLQEQWFRSSDVGQALDTQTLALIIGRKQKSDLHRALLADLAAQWNLAQLKEFNDLFLTLDADNDGSISAREIRQVLSGRWQDHDIDRLITCLMTSADGSIRNLSYEEFMGGLIAAQAPQESAVLRQIFDEADGDRKGWLSEAEVSELARRPAVSKWLGDRPAVTLMQDLDLNRDGKVTFEEFRRVVQGGKGGGGGGGGAGGGGGGGGGGGAEPPTHRGPAPAAPAGTASGFSVGQEVEYWSGTHRVWIKCRVTAVDPGADAVQTDAKPNFWVGGEALSNLRKPTAASRGGAVAAGTRSRYRAGQAAQLWSTTYQMWMACTVTDVDEASGAVQVDQKPGYWFQGHELQTRLRESGLQPPSREASKAGIGRQLLGGVFTQFGYH